MDTIFEFPAIENLSANIRIILILAFLPYFNVFSRIRLVFLQRQQQKLHHPSTQSKTW
jgi:hypothetical protein